MSTAAGDDGSAGDGERAASPVRDYLRTYVIGLCMGMADGVPGVSGGTIALIAGVYERLIDAVTELTPARAVQLLRAAVPGVRSRATVGDGGAAVGTEDPAPAGPDAGPVGRVLAVLRAMDALFLVTLGLGIMTAVVAVTRFVEWAAEHHPVLLFGFFFGLIGASAVVLWRELTIDTAGEAVAAVAGFLVAFLVAGESTALAGDGLLLVFVAGALAVSAMILPGISGSLILVILGQYVPMSNALSAFVDAGLALVTERATAPLVRTAPPVVTFVLGGGVGLLSISRAVRWALDEHRGPTLAFLVSLVVGALRAPVVEVQKDTAFTAPVLGAFAGLAVVGAAVVLLLDWYAVDLEL